MVCQRNFLYREKQDSYAKYFAASIQKSDAFAENENVEQPDAFAENENANSRIHLLSIKM